ncbi:MAG TPA: hypothetical protein PKC28_16525, partial [Bdellovibrionales bacterium]|nr:hypothetical protein [Bdellovibrionales bacterium]
MKHIKDLEAAGFQRGQAEAQVQMVPDAIEGNLATKSDFALFKGEMAMSETRSEHRAHQCANMKRSILTPALALFSLNVQAAKITKTIGCVFNEPFFSL